MPHPLQLGAAGSPGTDIVLEQDGSRMRRTVLPGGVRVLSEELPAQRSVTIGAWLAVGSRDEEAGHYGSTHFLEHLLFKGTASRSALDISSAFDAVGGEANAATGKEHTCYYARVMGDDLPMALDVIIDMVTSPTLSATDFDIERGVILEELAMASDDPTDVVHEQFDAAVLGPHPLGRPIGGNREAIAALARDSVAEHYRDRYRPEELVITAAGAVDHDELCRRVQDALQTGGWLLTEAAEPAARRSPRNGELARLPARGQAMTIQRSTEQANVILGCPGLSARDERRFTLSVLMTVLGGGTSSRLFQEIRERRGLAYATYAFAASYAEAGTVGLYAGCTPSRVADVAALLGEELDNLARKPVGDDELERARGQLAGSLVLGLEDSGSRMLRLGQAEIVHGELTSIDEMIERIRAVNAANLAELAGELAAGPRSLVVVGPDTDDVAAQALGA